MRAFIGIVFIVLSSFSIAQQPADSIPEEDSLYFSEAMLSVMEQSLIEYYKDYVSTDGRTDSIIKALGYEKGDVPVFSDSVYCARITEMNEMNPFHLDCTPEVLTTIKYFARKRRRFTKVALGRSKLYFDMYEEKLAANDMPIELKYLSVIESGLRPQVKSRVGATGLWQFMYRTGKKYGLNENSYYDERMDPEKATEAACKFLKRLHRSYNDWNMALAAYNAGPGNVNKAIRRSGGKRTYWEIRPYLPRETQGYVPNFIAMSYMMTYHAEHNIYPAEAKIYDFELDTVCLSKGVHMESIDTLMSWDLADIKLVNPVYKTSYIPKTTPPQCINIPTVKLGEWVAIEDTLFYVDSSLYSLPTEAINISNNSSSRPSGDAKYHTVRSGESLSVIASKYGTTTRKLMDWNNLSSTRLRVGQKLKLYGVKTSSTSKSKPKPTTKPNSKPTGNSTYYTVRSGDSLWKIGQKHSKTVSELKALNPGINIERLDIGQKIRVN